MRQLGKYRLLFPIASGGMAEVWLAELTGPAGFVKRVALKLVRADRLEDSEMARLFIREAHLASRLHHANIVHVFGFERVDGRYAIAMELVHGQSLRSVLDRCREAGIRFGLPRSVHVAAEVAKALAYAHRPEEDGGAAGIVHRDVSPHNVLVSFEGEVKLADFGIARTQDGGGLTHPGTVKGKAGYMPPEQWNGGSVDGRADIFALGVMLWEMCAGRRLFARETDAATLAAVEKAPVSPPSEWNEDVPPELDDLVLAALERDPARRTASATEMAQALADIRLQLARTSEEQDLGSLMRRLWPLEEMRRFSSRSAVAQVAKLDGQTVPPSGRRHRHLRAAGWALLGVGALAGSGWWLRSAQTHKTFPATAAGAREAARAVAAPANRVEGQANGTTGREGGLAAVFATDTASGTAAGPVAVAPPKSRRAQPVVREACDRFGGLAIPPVNSGEGVLFVNTVPWAEVSVDGQVAGDTPREMRLAGGAHRLKLKHPTLGAAERTVEVRAGERVRFEPVLERF